MKITVDLLPVRLRSIGRRSGRKIDKVKFFTDHDTGTPNATAKNVADYYKRTADDESVSFHLITDDIETRMLIPCLNPPTTEKAWHVNYASTLDNEKFGGNANDIAIGMELCYFPDDELRTLKAYHNYIDVAVDMLIIHNVKPNMRESHGNLQPWNRTDPNNALKNIGMTYEDMKKDIAKEYEKRINMLKDWEDILTECLDAPEISVRGINTIKEMASLNSNLGDLEGLKWADKVVEKVFAYGYEQGRLSK